MTNIVPQSPKCNQGAWERFERYCRELADDGKELYIAAGPHGLGGVSSDGAKKLTIGRNAPFVSVPASVWKVVLVLDKGTNPTKSTNASAPANLGAIRSKGLAKNSASNSAAVMTAAARKTPSTSLRSVITRGP